MKNRFRVWRQLGALDPPPKRDGRVCPSCNLVRTDYEFHHDTRRDFVNCKSCRAKGKSQETQKRNGPERSG